MFLSIAKLASNYHCYVHRQALDIWFSWNFVPLAQINCSASTKKQCVSSGTSLDFSLVNPKARPFTFVVPLMLLIADLGGALQLAEWCVIDCPLVWVHHLWIQGAVKRCWVKSHMMSYEYVVLVICPMLLAIAHMRGLIQVLKDRISSSFKFSVSLDLLALSGV